MKKTIDAKITNCIIATNETEKTTYVLLNRAITIRQDCAELDTGDADM